MPIVAMAPSLNSNEVPPSTTMQASQHRERTLTLERQRHRNVSSAHLRATSFGDWRALNSLAGEASLPTAGEHSVDDGLSDAVEQTSLVRTEHQRLVVFISDCAHRQASSHERKDLKAYNCGHHGGISNSPFSIKSGLSGISRPVWDFPEERHTRFIHQVRQWFSAFRF